MREARIKVPVESGDAVYHCTTRVVNGERLLDETAREVLRKQLWQVAAFCGVQIHTYDGGVGGDRGNTVLPLAD